MRVYRIAKRGYIEDLSDEGARLNGGRWNKKGTSLLYTSETRSLATVEYLVHIPMSIIPKDICIAQIEIPKEISTHTIDEKELPQNWSAYPAPMKLSEIIENLIKENDIPVIRVPSVIVKGEWNILINPKHKDFRKITISEISEWYLDERLLRK